MFITRLKEIHFRLAGIPVLALIMTLILDIEPQRSLVQKFFISLLFVGFFWNGGFMIFIYFRKRFPEIRQTPRRLSFTLVSFFALILLGDPLLCLIFGFKTWPHILQPAVMFEYSGINFVSAFIVGSIYENVYFFEQWKNSIKLNEALKNQQIRTQFEVLQNQMSPHFLFNSLNTLTTLIPEDQNVAVEFTQNLSEVYRYILQNKDKELVTLHEELEFAGAYSYLLQIRYPENLHVEFDVDKKYHDQHIAPLTIQMLIENAIKHNTISKTHPLTIEVYVENGLSIVVKNNLKQKNVIEKSTKTGLVNIKKRYEYLGVRPVDVITTAQNFLVAIPLIKLVNKDELLSSEQ